MHLWQAISGLNPKEIWSHLRYNNRGILYRDIRFFFQRLVRGWDDSETFSLDHSLAKLIAPRLRRFRDVTIGTPGMFEGSEGGREKWLAELDSMVKAFEFYASDEYFECNDQEKLEDTNKAIELFAKRYGALWW